MPDFLPFFSRWRQNPIILKELRGRMRGRRAFVVLSIYLFVMISMVTLVYLSANLNAGSGGNPGIRNAGKSVFSMVLVVQALLVFFVGPIFTTGGITGEKERQTFELLRTTLLPPPALLLGKLASGLAYIVLLIIASIPVQSIAFLLGGITLADLALTQAIILISAITYAMLGLFYSGVMRSTLSATVLTLGTVLLTLVGLPMLFIFADMFNLPYYRVLPYNGEFLLASTNVVASLVNIMAGNSLYGSLLPTLIFVGFYAGITLILFALTLRRLDHSAND